MTPDFDPGSIRSLWSLETDMVFLNHGSYGATPRAVQEEQTRWRALMEQQPVRFMLDHAPREIRAAADRLAAFLGAEGQEIGFVENATAGVNAVLGSMDFDEGDEVIITDHVYNAVRNTLRHRLEPVGACLVTAKIGMPVPSPNEVHDRVMAALTPATRLILLDHVASVSAAIFPVAEIAASAREQGVAVLIDGAHGPGLIDLNVPTLGVDWYVGNCHKWLCAPKGAGFVWAAAERQVGLHPPVISHALGQGFAAEFDMVGTRDASAWLSVPAAIDLHEKLGGAGLRERNRSVALEAAARLAARWNTGAGASPEQFGGMVTVRLPDGLAPGRENAERLRRWVWEARRIELVVSAFAEAHWLRMSVPAYVSAEDCDAAGPAIEAGLEALVP
ncbi:MAG: aminotransferase class V-fold PLP-dependent enzyme [Pseudomonadota bacterium]